MVILLKIFLEIIFGVELISLIFLKNQTKPLVKLAKAAERFGKGDYVNDFHALNKDRIFVMVHSAVQEIDRIQQAEKTKLAAAETKITTLETENAALKSRIEAIEAHLGLNQ